MFLGANRKKVRVSGSFRILRGQGLVKPIDSLLKRPFIAILRLRDIKVRTCCKAVRCTYALSGKILTRRYECATGGAHTFVVLELIFDKLIRPLASREYGLGFGAKSRAEEKVICDIEYGVRRICQKSK